ncbi:MAG: hypothetical protein KGL09_04930 [Pseudomonadota bacterium]|nr:hypothetical protein [Pseudomonadota bacterium]MDE3141141.1 hypothetical protein [Pseudomonadota bacterium]
MNRHPWARPAVALLGGLLVARLLPRPAQWGHGGGLLLRALRLLRP